MNKKWLIVIISLIFIVTLIGVGGKMYIDKRAEQKEAEKIEAEKMSVEALKNTFADIESVEFEKSGYNEMMGTYRMFVQMTNQSGRSVEFSFSYSKNTPEQTRGYMLENEELQVEGVTTNKVQVTYSNEEDGEV